MADPKYARWFAFVLRSRWAQLRHTSDGESRYQAYKYHGLHMAHLWSMLCIMTCTVIFAALWWNDRYLTDTIFPQVFHLRVALYSASAGFEAAACLVFRFVKRSKRCAATETHAHTSDGRARRPPTASRSTVRAGVPRRTISFSGYGWC